MRYVALTALLLAALSLAVAASASSVASPWDIIEVTSPGDDGLGTLRRALEEAQIGDTIIFDPTVFPPASPVTISVTSELPALWRGSLTIDASDAGVILDGGSFPGDWEPGLQIVNSDGNTIRGLQISNFSGRAIDISGDSQYNVIGGDRTVGSGPFGQGNLLIKNGNGIVMSHEGTTLNTITGNLIGTDAAGAVGLGNSVNGVWIVDGPNGNTIGPDNVIAYNGRPAIEVQGFGSLHNTITQNSIHGNGWQGIDVGGSTGAEVVGPTIFDFDLSAGTATGTTCPGCLVEIFSDNGDEGGHFEGQATADGRGSFAFNRGAAFVGPHLTATATDRDGTTSEFSPPTSGATRSLTLQAGNGLTATHLQHRHSRELPDNRIGFGSVGRWSQSHWDQHFYNVGLKRLRVFFNRQEPPAQWDVPEFEIPAEGDALVTRLADNGFIMKYYLTFWDKATYPNGEGYPSPRFKTEGEIENYLEYVRFIVNHFKDRVQYYELWNEPDVPTVGSQGIELADYLKLVERTVPVIREEYPEARIAVGAVSGIRHYDPYQYLLGIVESDVMPLVDVVSWHPFYGESPEHEELRDYYYDYPSIALDIMETATAHGFDGEFQVDELTWWTPHPFGDDHPLVISPIAAAKYTSRAIVMHLGMDMATTINEGAGTTLRNLCTVMAGASPAALPLQIQTTVTDTVSYTFALPNSNWLVALWTDGVAAEYDPHVVATMTLPGFAGHTVTGIDVLYGFEQPIIATKEGSGLVIHDLLVKDYPVILKVSPIVSPAVVAITGPAAGGALTSHSFTATVDPITVTVPVTYAWQATGQSVVTHGASLTATDRVSFTWATTGTKSITVTAGNEGGAVSSTHLVTIYEPLVADFVAAPTSGIVPLTVVFTNTSTGAHTDSLWQFGDGLTSTLGSPTHTYASVGSYTVTLSIDGPGGADAAIRDAYITVDPYRIYLPLVTRDREARRRRGVTRGQPAFKGRR